MGSELFSTVIETKLLKGKALVEQTTGKQDKQNVPRQATLQLYLHKKYTIPARKDVEIERTVWTYRSRGKKLATV